MAASPLKSDFSGYVTKNDVRCSDGRIIRQDAFADCDGMVVPLCFQHEHTSPESVIGKVLLENRPDGVYGYGYLNDTQSGRDAKEIIQHGDMLALSIAANKVTQRGSDVVHGMIREVSLVFAGANPEAHIDNILMHSDEGDLELNDQITAEFPNDTALVHGDLAGDPTAVFDEESIAMALGFNDYIEQADPDDADMMPVDLDQLSDDELVDYVSDNLNSLDPDQIQALQVYMYAMQNGTDSDESEDNNDVQHSQGGTMNIFENNGSGKDSFEHSQEYQSFVSHAGGDYKAAQKEFLEDAAKSPSGSLKQFTIQHAQDYGIQNIDVFFPDARMEDNLPTLYKRDTAWVADVLSNVHKVPFTRIKSEYVDITADEARAKGYTLDRDNNHRKYDEMIKAFKRTTTPTTIYKKQKLDRDDILDITDFDTVAFLKAEMRIMLDEEVARAYLIGDGREVTSEEHINTESIRPIVSDDDLYVIHSIGTAADETVTALVDRIRQSLVGYMGSGSLTAYISPSLHAKFAVQRDQIGHRMYDSDQTLAFELGVANIVEVPLLENFTNEAGNLVEAILVNLRDYSVGTDNGGDVAMFDDFDIDYNQYKYLMETRQSAALVKPKSAIVIEAPKA